MRRGNVYQYMYDGDSSKLKYPGQIGKQFKFQNLTENIIEVLPKASLQGLVEVKTIEVNG